VVDTHAHLSACEPDAADLVTAARRVGVRRILTVGMDEASNREAIAAAGGHQEVFACVGRHPNAATGFDREAAAEIETLAAGERVVAVGETGLDYYRDRTPRGDQRAAFEAQIAIARRTGLPLVIHMRDPAGGDDALSETFATLAAKAEGVTVVLHCCSAPPERVPEAVERGWYCSFAGNVTYPKADTVRETARLVPDELLLVETDSPFLAPQSVRGKPNQPAHVVEVAERLAAEREIGYEVLERIVDANAARVFQW
jgi:TatD DNase family protein